MIELSKGLLEEVELLAGLEAYRFAGSDGDFGSSARITTDSSFPGFNSKDTKAAELNTIPRDQSLFHAFEDGIHSRLCLGSRQSCAFDHSLN